MTSTKYERGRDAEYRAVKELKKLDYEATRTAGSHGSADVIAWNKEGYRHIQCKTFIGTTCPNYKTDIQKLADTVLPPGSTRELWIRRIGQHGWYARYRVTPAEIPLITSIELDGSLITSDG